MLTSNSEPTQKSDTEAVRSGFGNLSPKLAKVMFYPDSNDGSAGKRKVGPRNYKEQRNKRNANETTSSMKNN